MSAASQQPDQQFTAVRIGLPLPLDVSGSLIQVLGAAWPGAQIGSGTPNEMVVMLPRSLPAAVDDPEELVMTSEPEIEGASITEMGPGQFSMGIPADLLLFFVGIAGSWFQAYPEATNYLEQRLIDPETRRGFVVTVQRDEGKSPHDLRELAEAERDSFAAENRLLKAALAKLKAGLPNSPPD